jgi:hypothetical protein
MPTVERRAERRYAIQARVEYKLSLGRKAAPGKVGRLVNISRGGLLFECAEAIPPGTGISLDVEWPTDALRIALHVTGQIVRSQHARAAVKISRSSFRVREPAERPAATSSNRRR